MTRAQAVAAAFGLFAVWTLATYLLEARLGTFLRPDATTRFVYTVVANVLIGTIGCTGHSHARPAGRVPARHALRHREAATDSRPRPGGSCRRGTLSDGPATPH